MISNRERRLLVNRIRQLARRQELMHPHSNPTCLELHDMGYRNHSASTIYELLYAYEDFIGPKKFTLDLWFGRTTNNPMGCDQRVIALGLLAAMVESGDVL